MFKTDLEIAQECKMEHIRDIAAKIGVGEEDLEYYGNYKAKVSLDLLHRNEAVSYTHLDVYKRQIGGCAPVQKEATFLKASNRFHFPGEDMEESLIVRFKKEGGDGVRVTGIADYKADTVVDPRYVIDEEAPMEDEDFYAYGIQLPMFKGMKVSFSKITYQKDQEEKTADIGIYEIEKNGMGIEEASISKNWDSEEKELYIDVYTKETGCLLYTSSA